MQKIVFEVDNARLAQLKEKNINEKKLSEGIAIVNRMERLIGEQEFKRKQWLQFRKTAKANAKLLTGTAVLIGGGTYTFASFMHKIIICNRNSDDYGGTQCKNWNFFKLDS